MSKKNNKIRRDNWWIEWVWEFWYWWTTFGHSKKPKIDQKVKCNSNTWNDRKINYYHTYRPFQALFDTGNVGFHIEKSNIACYIPNSYINFNSFNCCILWIFLLINRPLANVINTNLDTMKQNIIYTTFI